jgi:hypothetical protein
MWDQETKRWLVTSIQPIQSHPPIIHLSTTQDLMDNTSRLTIAKQRPRRFRNVGSVYRKRTRSERPVIKRSGIRRIRNRIAEMGPRPQTAGEELVGRVWDCDGLICLGSFWGDFCWSSFTCFPCREESFGAADVHLGFKHRTSVQV